MPKKKNEQRKRKKREYAHRNRPARQRDVFSKSSNGEGTVEYNITIHEEPMEMKPPLSPESTNKVSDAGEFADEGNYVEALKLLNEVNAVEPGRPSVIYNIAMFRTKLGDKDIYDETIDKLIKDFPDYHFGKVAHARRLIGQLRLDEAWEVLRPLHNIKSMHISEFKALCIAMVSYYFVGGREDAARSAYHDGIEYCGDSFPSWKILEQDIVQNYLSELAKGKVCQKYIGKTGNH